MGTSFAASQLRAVPAENPRLRTKISLVSIDAANPLESNDAHPQTTFIAAHRISRDTAIGRISGLIKYRSSYMTGVFEATTRDPAASGPERPRVDHGLHVQGITPW